MKNLVKHVQNMNAIHNMWNDFDTLIIGVSGGSDSMCLMDVMLRIAKKEQLSLIVAHVNYGLRGEDADQDQYLVELVARENQLPCETLVVRGGAGQNEDQWRAIRYDFFEKIRSKYDAAGIVVAHNQNDQAETFLLHLLRGSGLAGLVGMRFVSDNHVIRPLLSVPLEEIKKYCKIHDIAYHHDRTNDDVSYARNKIRKELIPYLQENYNVQIVTTITRAAETIADDLRCVNAHVDIFWKKQHDHIVFSVQTFCGLSVAMQRRSLLTMITELTGSTKDIEKGMIDEMRKVIFSTKNKQQTFCGKNLKMLKKNGTVELACHA